MLINNNERKPVNTLIEPFIPLMDNILVSHAQPTPLSVAALLYHDLSSIVKTPYVKSDKAVKTKTERTQIGISHSQLFLTEKRQPPLTLTVENERQFRTSHSQQGFHRAIQQLPNVDRPNASRRQKRTTWSAVKASPIENVNKEQRTWRDKRPKHKRNPRWVSFYLQFYPVLSPCGHTTNLDIALKKTNQPTCIA